MKVSPLVLCTRFNLVAAFNTSGVKEYFSSHMTILRMLLMYFSIGLIKLLPTLFTYCWPVFPANLNFCPANYTVTLVMGAGISVARLRSLTSRWIRPMFLHFLSMSLGEEVLDITGKAGSLRGLSAHLQICLFSYLIGASTLK